MLLNHGYPSELKRKSSEELAAYCVELFHENINWTSTTHSANSTNAETALNKKSKKECYDHFLNMFKSVNSLGFRIEVKDQSINGLSGKVSVEIELMDADHKPTGHKMFMEDTWKCNEDGFITELKSVCKEQNK